MARTSKTRLNKPGESSDRMMRANMNGRQSVERQLDRDQQDKRASQARGQQAQAQGLSALGQAEGRRQQADQFQSSQQESSRRFDAQQTDRAAGRAQQSEQFDRTAANNEARTDLQGAQAGFERGGRAAQLESEMNRGAEQTGGGPGAMDATGGRGPGQLSQGDQERLQGQVSQPMEMDGQWRPTAERKAGQQEERKRKNYQADTQRMNAETARFNAELRADEMGASYQRAAMEGRKEEQDALSTELAKPIMGNLSKFDRMMNDDSKPQDWGDLKKMVNESQVPDPTLMADIEAENNSPRVQQFMRSQISRESLKFIMRTGSTSKIDGIDWTAPQMEAFTQQVGQVNAMAKSMGPEFSKLAGIRSVEDKMAFVRTQAAMMVYAGMDQYQQADTDGNGFVMGEEQLGLQEQGSQPDPSGGMPPSLGGQQEQAAMEGGIDPNAVSSQDSTGTRHRVTSEEETQDAIRKRKAGEYTPPADQRQRPTRGRTTPLTGGYH